MKLYVELYAATAPAEAKFDDGFLNIGGIQLYYFADALGSVRATRTAIPALTQITTPTGRRTTTTHPARRNTNLQATNSIRRHATTTPTRGITIRVWEGL